jgi:DNA-binding NarL/FixJ family response regulator
MSMSAWVMGVGLIATSGVCVVLGLAVSGLRRRVAGLEAGLVRVDRMGEAVTLLSETAEAGFAAVAQEIEKMQRAPVSRATGSRTTVSRRVVKAATRGESVEQIARREALSEGEVRLHLALAETSTVATKGARRASLRA